MSVMYLRAYANAKSAIDNAKKQSDVPQTPMVQQVAAIQLELMRENQRSVRQGGAIEAATDAR